MWFVGVEVEQEMSAPPPKKNPGSAPAIIAILYSASDVKFYFRAKLRSNLPLMMLPFISFIVSLIKTLFIPSLKL